MSDDQDGCEWVNVSSGTGLPGKWLCVRVRACMCDNINSVTKNLFVHLHKFVSVIYMCMFIRNDIVENSGIEWGGTEGLHCARGPGPLKGPREAACFL